MAHIGNSRSDSGFWKRDLIKRIPRLRWKYNIEINVQEVGCGHGLD